MDRIVRFSRLARAVRPRPVTLSSSSLRASSSSFPSFSFFSSPSSSSSTPTSPPPSTPSSSPTSSGFSTINAAEISHFSRLSSKWWDESGEFALLHRMNPARVEYIRRKVALEDDGEGWTFEGRARDREREERKGTGKWLKGKRVLDVGCGGGLLAEALARLGGEVLAIDAAERNISIAQTHASSNPLLGDLEYRHTSAEALRDAGEKFDVVCSMEVVEHVDEPGEFLKCLGDMVKPGGHLILSTISRTPLAQLLTLTLAEDVLRLVTPGTHTYSKFIRPSELRRFVFSSMGGYDVWESPSSSGGGVGSAADVRFDEVGETRGIVYDPLGATWRLWEGAEGTWVKEVGEGCNYMYHARKRVV